jgi:MFS family permease
LNTVAPRRPEQERNRESRQPTRRRTSSAVVAWFTVALLLLLNIVALLDRQVISLLVEPIKAELAISDFQIGLLQGFAFALLYCLCAVPIGWAVDRISRRLIIFAGVFIWGTATIACGLAGSFETLLAARIFVGLGEAALAPAAFSILSDLFPRARLALVLSIYSTGSVLGAASALAISATAATTLQDGLHLPLVGTRSMWQSVLIIVGLPGLILSFLIFAVPEPPRARTNPAEATFAALRRFAKANARFLTAHMAGFALIISIAYGSLAWLPTILQRTYGLSLTQTGNLLALIIGVSGVAGNLLNGAAVDRIYSRGHKDAHLRYYLGCSIVIVCCSLLSVFPTHATLYLVALIPILVLANLYGVAAAAIQIATPSRLRGKMSAIYLAVVNLFGMIIGPSAVAIIGEQLVGGDRLNLALGCFAAVVSLLAIGCFAVGLKPMRQAVSAAESEAP